MTKDAISERQILESKTLFPILRHQQLLWVVGRMCLALLREWEGEFRRHADGTDGIDTRECSTIDFSRCLFFVITGVYEGTKACGKHRDGCGDPSRIGIWYLLFTYTPVYR